MPPKTKKSTDKKGKPKKEKTIQEADSGKKKKLKPRKVASTNSEIQGEDKLASVAPPVLAEAAKKAGGASQAVINWVQRALDMGVNALREEYRALAKYTLPEMTMDAFRANHEAGRNRYQDVPCQDQARVVLKWPGCPIDYVHANYVSTPQGAKRFICTQGPLDCTVTEFWTMIVQEEVSVVVMLCNTVECGKLKCAQYWPETEADPTKVESPAIEIVCKGSTMLPNEPTVKKTILLLKYKDPKGKDCERTLHHFQWLDWPDRGVPPCRLTAMELLSCVRGSKQPIVVHCSAGIGRTGTIVAIEYIMERLAVGQECAAMNELLKELRNQRAYSIQNDLQYLYVHRVMLCYFLEKHKERHAFLLDEGTNKTKYAKFVEEYNAATGN